MHIEENMFLAKTDYIQIYFIKTLCNYRKIFLIKGGLFIFLVD